MNYKILTGDNRVTLKTLADNSIDAIITDPPYGIDFLGKAWDANTGALETYQECLRVLKPGGHILAFSAARTYHHLAVTLEQAGFEIRDQIMWIYSSGFPKSQDIGKQLDKKNIDNAWAGWGTALKPAHEPIALARKPIKTSIRENCLKYGTGALNIDATRVEVGADEMESFQGNWDRVNAGMGEYAKLDGSVAHGAGQLADQMKDISGYKPQGRFPSNVVGDIPDYQKYFYCPKVSRKERHIGHDNGSVPSHNEMAQAMGGSLVDHDGNPSVSGNKALIPGLGEIYTHGLSKHYDDWCKQNGHVFEKGNNHPTVKPIELMKYLIKLITPPGGVVLDPFNGSGSTGCAAVELGHTYIGCELDPAYVDIASKRIEAWYLHTRDPVKEIFE